VLSQNIMERRLQVAGSILILGLLAEALSVAMRGPIAFLIFVGLAGLLLLAGLAAYLLAIARSAGGNA
jgi:hypothetical protein